MSELGFVAVVLLYIAIGAFVARLLDEGDDDYIGFIVATWPGVVAMWLMMVVFIIIPCKIADKLRKK